MYNGNTAGLRQRAGVFVGEGLSITEIVRFSFSDEVNIYKGNKSEFRREDGSCVTVVVGLS